MLRGRNRRINPRRLPRACGLQMLPPTYSRPDAANGFCSSAKLFCLPVLLWGESSDMTEASGSQNIREAGSLGRQARRWRPEGTFLGDPAQPQRYFDFSVPQFPLQLQPWPSDCLHFLPSRGIVAEKAHRSQNKPDDMKTICKLGRVAFSLMGLPDIAGLQTLAFCEAGDLAPSLSHSVKTK